MSYTHKIKDGVRVPLSAGDIAELNNRDAAWTSGETRRQAEFVRFNGLKTDPVTLELINRLATTSNTDVDAWFAANVTDTVSAIAVLKTVCKLLAVKLVAPGPSP